MVALRPENLTVANAAPAILIRINAAGSSARHQTVRRLRWEKRALNPAARK